MTIRIVDRVSTELEIHNELPFLNNVLLSAHNYVKDFSEKGEELKNQMKPSFSYFSFKCESLPTVCTLQLKRLS